MITKNQKYNYVDNKDEFDEEDISEGEEGARSQKKSHRKGVFALGPSLSFTGGVA